MSILKLDIEAFFNKAALQNANIPHIPEYGAYLTCLVCHFHVNGTSCSVFFSDSLTE